MTKLTCAPILAAALSLPSVGTAASLPVTVNGNTASARVTVGVYTVDVTLTFEQVVGLSASNLGLSARIPTAAELLDRLPAGVNVPTAFPVLVAVEPPAAGGLSFSGVATIELHTHNLGFPANCPFRVFVSHGGGPFTDATDAMGMGSYRGRGRTGGFSDFLILADLRPTGDVVDLKLAALWDLLTAYDSAIAPTVAADLADALGSAQAAWDGGDPLAAIRALEGFEAIVAAESGSAVPDVWRSARDLVNVAGELRAASATARFSLGLAA